MNNDALERLKNKNRPVVQSRDASLDTPFLLDSGSIADTPSPSLDIDSSGSRRLDIEVAEIADCQVAGSAEIGSGIENSSGSNSEVEANSQVLPTPETLEAQPAQIAKSALKGELETKQSTLRLEAQISDRLHALCRGQGICREVLIEAMFEYCEVNPAVLNAVLTQASEKNDYRQDIANWRRAKSMMEKFGG